MPQSLARLHHRKDLTYRTLVDAPQSGIALSWPEEATTDLVEDFIGVVRGRTVNSTRGRATAQEQPKAKAQEQPRRKRPDTTAARRKPAPAKKATPGRRGKPRRRS